MSFLHQKSCECTKTELDLFSIPPTQTSIETGKWVQYKPISSLTDDAPIEFVVPANGEEYGDLSQTFIQVKARILKADGTRLTTDEESKDMGPINNCVHSLFCQVDMYMNGKLVTPQSNTYAYRAYIETLLNYGWESKVTGITRGIWNDDYEEHMDDIAEANGGLKSRRKHFAKSALVDMAGRLHLDMCTQNKYLLNGVELRFKFTRSKNKFFIMANQREYKVHISDVNLWMRRCKISPSVLLAHNKTLQSGTAKYPITRVDIKNFTLPAGILSKTVDNVFLRQIPKRIIFGMVTNAAYNGDFKKNPYNFQHFNMNYFALYIDGEEVPSKALQLNYDTNEYVMAYNTLFSGTGLHFSDFGHQISRDLFKRGYNLLAFDLTPDLSASDTSHWNLVRNGSLRMEVGFSAALADTINCLVYAEFDNVIEIDRHRNVNVDFSA